MRLRSALAGLAVALLAAPAANALPPIQSTPGWRFITVDHPSANGQTYLTSLRNDGTAVGAYADSAGRYHGVIRAPSGAFTTVDYPGARDTYVLGINKHGALAGTWVDKAGVQHGFIRHSHGTFQTVDVPGNVATNAQSEFGPGLGSAVATIADDGTLVGDWGDAKGSSHGFIQRPGDKRVDIDAPEATTAVDALFGGQGGTNAIRANKRGQIVGSYAPAPRRTVSPVDLRAFVKTGDTWTTLLPQGMATSQAFALTNGGKVGGAAFDIPGLTGWGWIWRPGEPGHAGEYTRIDPKAFALFSTVADINHHGVISGEYVTADGNTHGYIGFPPAR